MIVSNFVFLLLVGCLPWCTAYHVSISHIESFNSIEFYKSGKKLPDFLVDYDFSDYIEDENVEDRVLRANTHDAYFDSVILQIKSDACSKGENITVVINVVDEETMTEWGFTFETQSHCIETSNEVVVTLDKGFITASPLESVQIVDTMQ